MLLQSLVVAVIVLGCAVYAGWTLMPATWRRAVALALLGLPLPAGAASMLRKHSTASSGCACDGCDRGSVSKKRAASSSAAPIVLHRRSRR